MIPAWACDTAYCSALLGASPYLAYRAIRSGRYRKNLAARFLGQQEFQLSPAQRVWFHGVSVGEIHLLRPVIAGFRCRFPAWQILVSASTDTGLDEARRCFADLPVIQFPLDFSWAVQSTLKAIQPQLLVLAEGDLWPNLLRAAREQQLKIAVVNGRFSPRSARRYQKLARFARPMLQCIDLFAMQTEEYAEGLRSLGVPSQRIAVTGSVKYDGLSSRPDNPKTEALRRLFGITPSDRVWVAGSTQTPEESIVLRIYQRLREKQPNLKLILVPRQKDRFDAVAHLLQRSGCSFARRGELTGPTNESIILVDTIGELSAVWGLADVAFVGGSMDGQRGGQNMIEPAGYGAAVTFGPHVWNFRDAVTRLLGVDGAIQVSDEQSLERVTSELFENPLRARQLGLAAQQFVMSQQGATDKTLDCLDRLIAYPLARVS